jgi:hypothetical protein
MRDADPALAGILRRCAPPLPAPATATWHDHFRRELKPRGCGSPTVRKGVYQQ